MKSNPKFDELAKQCYVKTGSIHSDHFDYVKFGELIVSECIMKINGASIRVESYDTLTNNIKTDFGVEE